MCMRSIMYGKGQNFQFLELFRFQNCGEMAVDLYQ